MIAASDTVCILLAAGQSRRFGSSNKLAAEFQGKPLARHAADTLAAIDFAAHVAVSTQESADLFDAPFDATINTQPEAGISHSIGLGVAAAQAFQPQAVLVALADMPLLPSTHFHALLNALVAHKNAAIVATDNAGRAQVPAIFKSSEFAKLTDLTADTGARELLKSARTVSCDPRYLEDFDTPEAIERWPA